MAPFGTSRFSGRFSGSSTKTTTGGRGRAAPAPLTSEQAVYECAVGKLARHAQTVAQLRRALRLRVEPGEAGTALIDAAIARLIDHGYLSDERFAKDYAGNRMTQSRLGRRRIANELQQKGIAAELIEQQVSAVFADTDEVAQAEAFLAKKRVRPPTDQREAARIFRMLARAGFGGGTATQVLRRLRAGSAATDQASEPDFTTDFPGD